MHRPSIFLALAILFVGANVLPAASGSAWPEWRGPERNGIGTSSVPLVESLPENPLLWESPTLEGKAETYASPVIADGRVFLHTAAEVEEMVDGKKKKRSTSALICYHLADGAEQWRVTFDGDCHNTPCVAGDQVLVLAGDGTMRSLKISDGSEVWTTKVGKNGSNVSPMVVDDMVITTSRKGLVALALADGSERWEIQKLKIWSNSPVRWQHDGTTYVIVGNEEIACIDPAKGAVVWTVPGTDRKKDPSSPAIHGDQMATMFEGAGLRIHRLSPAGAELVATCSGFQAQGGGAHQATSPVFDGKRVFGVDGEKTFCWDVASDQIVWQADKGDTHSSPLLIDGKLLVAMKGGGMMLDATSGEVLGRSESLNVASCSSYAFADGKLVGNSGSTIRCWNLAK